MAAIVLCKVIVHRNDNKAVSQINQQRILPLPSPERAHNGKNPEIRLLLTCQAEGLQSRYSELSSEDSGLTALGWEQTNSLARWIVMYEKVDLLVSAPQLRSRLTAQRLGQVLRKSVSVMQEMPSHARSSPETSNDRHHLFAPLHRKEQFADQTSYTNFKENLANALQKVVHEQWGKTVCIVLDGNTIATALNLFCNSSDVAFSISHTSISEVAWHGGEWSIVYVNRLEHKLPAPLATNVNITTAEINGVDEDEDTSAVLAVYNRVLTADVDLEDQTREQRLRHLLKFANLPKGLRILDVGAGTGRLALLLAEEGASEVVGVDISPAMLEMAEYFRLSTPAPAVQRVSFRLATAQRMPFRNESFDAIVCRLVLHHSHKPDRIMQELLRLLKPGGVFIFADLVGPDDPVKRATQNTIEARRNPSHVAAQSVEQYRKLLLAAGLVIEAESIAIFEQDLEDWLTDLASSPTSRTIVREMMDAGLETDAAGLNVRRHSGQLVFDQRLLYMRATKPVS